MSDAKLRRNNLEFERFLLEPLVNGRGYSIVGGQEANGYVQFTIRKRVYVAIK